MRRPRGAGLATLIAGAAAVAWFAGVPLWIVGFGILGAWSAFATPSGGGSTDDGGADWTGSSDGDGGGGDGGSE
jgi:hypothetical protein